MAIADKYNDRSTLVDAIFDFMLIRAGSGFPVAVSFHSQTLADEFGVDYMEDKPGHGPTFEKVFDQDWSQLVKSCASWLASEDFFVELESSERMFDNYYRLSERGARLMGCLPSCLNGPTIHDQPGNLNL